MSMRITEPKARVLFLIPNENNVWEFHAEFDKFSRISTTNAIEGSTASISYADPDMDRFHKIYSSKKTDLSTDELNWLKSVLISKASEIVGINEDYWEGINEKLSKNDDSALKEYLVPVVNTMCLVWIDYWGYDPTTQTDKWLSSFSGIVSTINYSVDRGKTVSLTLNCVSYKRYLQTISVATYWQTLPELQQYSQNVNQFPAKLSEFLSKYNGGATYLLSNLGADQALELLLKMTDDWFTALPKKVKMYEGKEITLHLWGKTLNDYKGLSNIRNVSDEEWDKGNYDGMLRKIDDDNYALGSAHIDEFLRKPAEESNDYAYALSSMIMSKFSLFTPTMETIEGLLSKLFNTLYGDAFIDSNGNLIAGLPRYDNLPSLLNTDQDLSSYYYDQRMMFHGSNYIITERNNYSISDSEAPIVNFITVPGDFQYGILTDGTLAKFQAAYCWDTDDKLLKYGLRSKALEKIYYNKEIPVEALKAFGDTYINVFNSQAIQISTDLRNRPDLQMGRTIYLAEEGYVSYIIAITNNFVSGSGLSTSLRGSYTRRVGERIGTPWLAMRDIIEQKTFTGKYIVDSFIGDASGKLRETTNIEETDVLVNIKTPRIPSAYLDYFVSYEADYNIISILVDKLKESIGSEYNVQISRGYIPQNNSGFVRDNQHKSLSIVRLNGYGILENENDPTSPAQQTIAEYITVLESLGFKKVTHPDDNKYDFIYIHKDVNEEKITEDQKKYFKSVIYIGVPYA